MKKYEIKIDAGNNISLSKIIQDYLSIETDKAVLLIQQGSVWLANQRVHNPEVFLKDVEIKIYYPDKPIYQYAFNPAHIKYEDNDLMIVYKEAGINTGPSPFSDIDCLSYGIQEYYQQKGIDYHVSVINRLDQPTQGLVFFGKNKTAEKGLHRMFMERKVKKLYLAVTPEIIMKSVALKITSDVVWSGKIRKAKSYVRFLKTTGGASYFIVFPVTGRFRTGPERSSLRRAVSPSRHLLAKPISHCPICFS